MKRRQLFEFQDEPWFPSVAREGLVEILSLGIRYSGLARALAPAFARVVERVDEPRVLDLCSGAGGPVVLLLEALAARGEPLPRVLLSDLYPNVAAWTRLREQWPDHVDFVAEPVDATRIPSELPGGVVTIVNGLHHFPLSVAREVIAEVARRRAALFVAECFPRDLLRGAAFLPAAGLGFLVNPWVCERHGLLKAALSVPLPLLAATGLWDWLASVMRIHEPAELAVVAREVAPDYRWETGSAAFAPLGKAVYLVGLPPAEGGCG